MSFRKIKCLVYVQKNENNEHSYKNDLYKFDTVIRIKTEETYDTISNLMELQLANINNFYGKRSGKDVNPKDLFQNGDLIRVKMWYERDKDHAPDETNMYKGKNRVAIFNGFITEVGLDKTHTKLKCEDYGFWLKQKSLLFPRSTIKDEDLLEDVELMRYYVDDETEFENINNVKLSEIVRHCLWNFKFPYLQEDGSDIKYEIIADKLYNEVDFSLGTLKFENINIYEIFETIKKKYKIPFYFKYDRFYVGSYAETKDVLENEIGFNPEFSFGVNIINSKDLIYQRKEDMKIKLRINAFGNGNEKNKVRAHKYKKIINNKYPALYLPTKQSTNAPLDLLHELYVGHNIDSSFSSRDVFVYNDFVIKDETTGELTEMSAQYLYSMANNILEHYAYDGYRGSFLTFGEYVVYPGEVLRILSIDKDDKEVHDLAYYMTQVQTSSIYYLVKSVKREFSVKSPKFRQQIELGYAINSIQL